MTRFKHCEIEINTVCDLACMGCDRFTSVAPTGPMTLAQIEHFVQECLDEKWEWERIHILGGEPTLHADFEAIVRCLVSYRDHVPGVLLRVITNGLGKIGQYRTFLESVRVAIAEVPKLPQPWKPEHIPPYWDNMLLAPKDMDPNAQEVEPCSIFGIRGCGIGLTKHGFFLCGAGASIARVSGLDIGVMRLKDLTMEAMLQQAKAICCLCNHKEGFSTKLVNSLGQSSPYWERTLAAYKESAPAMSIYGNI